MSSIITGGVPTSSGVTITGGVVSPNLDDSLYTYLAAYETLAAYVSDRIYPDVAPQDETVPYIVYTVDSDQSMPIQSGVAGLRRAEYRFLVVAASIESRSQAADELRAALDGYRATMGVLPYFTAKLAESGMVKGRDPDTLQCWVELPFVFHYRES